jgi:hypothetical protein
MYCGACGSLLDGREQFCPKCGAAQSPASQVPPVAGISSQIQAHRAQVVVVHNNKLYIGFTLLLSLCAAFLAGCMVLMVFSLLFPLSALNFSQGVSAVQWGFGALIFGYMCPALWKISMGMIHHHVKMDSRGVDFMLGTKKAPKELFMPWDKVASIQQKRAGMAQQFTVRGSDGSYATFTSYTFARPLKVARLIAERTGIAIQKV